MAVALLIPFEFRLVSPTHQTLVEHQHQSHYFIVLVCRFLLRAATICFDHYATPPHRLHVAYTQKLTLYVRWSVRHQHTFSPSLTTPRFLQTNICGLPPYREYPAYPHAARNQSPRQCRKSIGSRTYSRPVPMNHFAMALAHHTRTIGVCECIHGGLHKTSKHMLHIAHYRIYGGDWRLEKDTAHTHRTP